MRVWDLSPGRLCRPHLLGEHREIHALWSVLTKGKKGYSHHPETVRWRKALKALFNRHERIASEMSRRGYRHRSPLDPRKAVGRRTPPYFVDTPQHQRILLKKKKCGCRV